MTPVVSSTLFGPPPTPRHLALVRGAGLLELCVDLDQLSMRPLPVVTLRRELVAAGLAAPCVHLPRVDPGASLDRLRRALDDARALGASTAVVHARARPAELGPACDAATERGLALAFEIDAMPGATAAELVRALASLRTAGVAHGLCLDTSRTRPHPAALDPLAPHLSWVEVSGGPGRRRHSLPAMDDDALRDLLARLMPRRLCFELTDGGPTGVAPGDLEIARTLRAINEWHVRASQARHEQPLSF